MSPYPIYKAPRPQNRRLRVFSFDPSLSSDLNTAFINQLTLVVPWEDVELGPAGEYLEVVDVDPASDAFYPPVDLDDNYLLVQDGLPPSEGTPQFHQQMVYAVASATIQNFEAALGRKILWSPRDGAGGAPEYIQRLRIYPHALRQANAYYSPAKKALLFGYFPASLKEAGRSLPGGVVFTCLSKDIVTHETTHALLDGLHPFFNEPSNSDVLAFHEAFADIVALFQHFSHPEVVRSQIAQTRGDLYSDNLLVQFARQFGEASGMRRALRSAIGQPADPAAMQSTTEPHARGSILVAAVFKAFLTVYNARTADLIRIATGGSGVLPAGAIHPDLVARLAEEAAVVSQHILNMCIRALDYCPPVDITFGEYLRALVTADFNLEQEDPDGYRIAMIDSFRERGIYPAHVRSLSEESLLWTTAVTDDLLLNFFTGSRLKQIQEYEAKQRRAEYRRETSFNNETGFRNTFQSWVEDDLSAQYIKKYSTPEAIDAALENSLNMKLLPDKKMKSIFLDRKTGRPEIKVISARIAYRVERSGRPHSDLEVELSQCRRGYLSQQDQSDADAGKISASAGYDFDFRGGATMLIDTATGRVRYVITKSIGSSRRLGIERAYLGQTDPSMAYAYSGNPRLSYLKAAQGQGELFALLHSGNALEEDF